MEIYDNAKITQKLPAGMLAGAPAGLSAAAPAAMPALAEPKLCATIDINQTQASGLVQVIEEDLRKNGLLRGGA